MRTHMYVYIFTYVDIIPIIFEALKAPGRRSVLDRSRASYAVTQYSII